MKKNFREEQKHITNTTPVFGFDYNTNPAGEGMR